MEAQLDVVLFDRTARFPKLTPEGELLLADTRDVVSSVGALKARAKLMAGGLEAELSVVVDAFFPATTIAAAAKAFAERFPLTPLRLFVEGLGAVYQPVLEERCSLGILASLPRQAGTRRVGSITVGRTLSADLHFARMGRRTVSALRFATRNVRAEAS